MSHDIAVIGDGCAALSLAAKAEQLPYNTLVKPNGAPEPKDHVWGFWSDETLEDAAQLARALGLMGHYYLKETHHYVVKINALNN